MSENNVNINIRTTGDTAGAENVTRALNDVEQRAERTAVTARTTATATRQVAAGMDQVRTSSFSAGRSMLVFSQGFEDLQYGISGVLNNIPGLVLALGGTAGLTGAISVAAVSLNILYKQFGHNTKAAEDSKNSLLDYFDEVSKVWKDIEALGDDDRKQQKEAADRVRDQQIAAVKRELDANNHTAKLDEVKEIGQNQHEIASNRLKMLQLESQLLFASGNVAIQIEKDRLAIVTQIKEQEKEVAEIHRQSAVNLAKAKVTAAEGADTAAKTRENTAAGAVGSKADEVAILRGEAQVIKDTIDARELEKQTILANIKELEDAPFKLNITKEDMAKEANDKLFVLPRLENQLAKLNLAQKDTKAEYANKQGQANAAEGSLNDATKNLNDTSKAQEQSSTALMNAVTELRQLKEMQQAERNNVKVGETDKAKDDKAKLGKGVTDSATAGIGFIGDNAKSKRRAISPAEQEAINRLRGIIGDSKPDADQGKEVAGILQGFANNLTAKDSELMKNIDSLIQITEKQVELIKAQNERINALESKANQKK